MSTQKISGSADKQIALDNETTAAFEKIAAARKVNSEKQNVASTEMAESQSATSITKTGNALIVQSGKALEQQVQSFS
jgi:hypothetical protein